MTIKLAALLLLSFHIAADSDPWDHWPAHRDLGVTYEVYEKEALSRIGLMSSKKSALGTARRWNEVQAELPGAAAWKKDFVMKRFKHLRDARFLAADGTPQLRRPSWLYPDDGCYARASMAVRNAFQSLYPIPGKVFAFGHLRVKTKNSPRGVVGWWYHVAPIIEVEGEKMVLDPAIEPAKPLTLLEWLSKMGKPEKMKVSICSSGTYSPGDNCAKETDGLERSAERAQRSYLKLERDRLKRLGRSVELELGDGPPWLIN